MPTGNGLATSGLDSSSWCFLGMRGITYNLLKTQTSCQFDSLGFSKKKLKLKSVDKQKM